MLLVVGAMVSQEVWWRSRGISQSVSDDVNLWCIQRDKADAAGHDVIAVLGASHMQLGFAPEAFHACNPKYKIANLAINGTFPIPILQDLAEDESFSGIVICGLMPRGIVPDAWKGPPVVYSGYHRYQWGYTKLVERKLRTYLQQSLSWFNQEVSLNNLIRDLARGRMPRDDYLLSGEDRFKQADYSLTDAEAMGKRRFAGVQKSWESTYRELSDAEVLDAVRQIDGWVKQIQARGGEVVFFRPITDEPFYSFETSLYPRDKYWDVLARNTSALTVHFADCPEFIGIDCPDGAHLNYADAKKVTRVLFDRMARAGIVAYGSDDDDVVPTED
ncbi:MAG: hypothetical protein R3C10_09400 [Pirellulales bacterium]